MVRTSTVAASKLSLFWSLSLKKGSQCSPHAAVSVQPAGRTLSRVFSFRFQRLKNLASRVTCKVCLPTGLQTNASRKSNEAVVVFFAASYRPRLVYHSMVPTHLRESPVLMPVQSHQGASPAVVVVVCHRRLLRSDPQEDAQRSRALLETQRGRLKIIEVSLTTTAKQAPEGKTCAHLLQPGVEENKQSGLHGHGCYIHCASLVPTSLKANLIRMHLFWCPDHSYGLIVGTGKTQEVTYQVVSRNGASYTAT